MIGVVIPLKSRVAAKDWRVTCNALQCTVNSLSQQVSKNYRAVVVGHERPDISFSDSVEFHSLDFPLPALGQGGSYQNRQQFDRILDKNRKIVRGLQILEHPDIKYWFYLDADDLLDLEFIALIEHLSPRSGCVIDGGYFVYRRVRRYLYTGQLSAHCGSTCVLAAETFRVPTSLQRDDLAQVPWCRYSHRHMFRFFEEELGEPCQRVLEPVVSYVLGHGDNCSDEFRRNPLAALKSRMKPWIRGKRLSSSLCARFGIA